MKRKPSLMFKLTTLAGVLAGGILAHVAHAGLVKIDGSSTVYPITEAVAEEFQKSVRGKTKVTVGISGTGGGFKKFCRGETDISNASRPILKKEMEDCKKAGVEYIELPVAFDALTVVVNPKNTFVDYLTVAELKKMWEPAAQGKINNWNQIRATFPNMPLKLAGAGADSGTFDYFTEAIVGKAKSSRGDYMATEDDNVTVQFVQRDPGALGYFGLAYYVENADKLKAVPIKADDKSPAVMPSIETVNKGTYQPLSRPLFIYVNRKSADNPEVAAFVEFYLKNGAKLAKEVGYVDLPARAYQLAMDNFKKRKVGTAFGGEPEVGVSVEELLAREGKL
ncbi:MAG: PstS family phosphate ABC transporter substrate-binding protein [Burkholderiales bacterium]|nr:PstS family phosphate ABC transporter substrate-binding protein [Burkholderiales bacterium]